MVHVISVQPAAFGWEVTSPIAETPQTFLSGAKAEAAARSLAEHLARKGYTAELRVHLHDGSLAGRFVCAPVIELPSAS